MIVTIPDREAARKLWGTPHYHVPVVRVCISDECPNCGGLRGKPRTERFRENGDYITISRWENPCGHLDKYADVLKEAQA